jgi:hypothetical protein
MDLGMGMVYGFYSRTVRAVRESPVVTTVVLLAVSVRVVFWGTYLPIWKNHAAFNVLRGDVLTYLSDFVGYVPGRLPFYDVLVAAFYILSNDVLGIRSLSFATLVLSVLSVPLFFAAVTWFFDRRVALFSTVFYGFYPKFVVFTAIGMPDAAAVSLLVVALYAIARGERTDRVVWFSVAGVFALLAWLMQISAVLAAMLFTTYVYSWGIKGYDDRILNLVPNVKTVAVSAPSFVVGVLFLLFGPTFGEIRALTGRNYLFTTQAYSLAERAIRYIAHVHIDFWWHLQGWDSAGGLWLFVDLFRDLFGWFFPLYAAGWLLVTLTLTAIVVVGVATLAPNWRSRRSLLVLAWIAVYAVLFNVRNFGWSGSFRTYHVFALVPAVAIAFGLGAVAVARSLEGRRLTERLPARDDPDGDLAGTLLTVALIILMVGFLVNAGVHGSIRTQNEQTFKIQPITALSEERSAGQTVAVFDQSRDFFNVVMYTEGKIYSTTITTEERKSIVETHHNRPLLVVTPEEFTTTDIDYVVVLTPCTDIAEWKQTYLDVVLEEGGEVVYRANSKDAYCSVSSVVVRMP